MACGGHANRQLILLTAMSTLKLMKIRVSCQGAHGPPAAAVSNVVKPTGSTTYQGKHAMDLYKLSVDVENRPVEITLQAGLLATAEFGRASKPKSKVSVLVGSGKQGLSAWVQVLDFETDGTARVTHDGWLVEGDGEIQAIGGRGIAKASLSRISNPTAEMLKCQQDADFGAMACCTSNGNGCHVTCCNACCSDPVGCPGASCCA